MNRITYCLKAFVILVFLCYATAIHAQCIGTVTTVSIPRNIGCGAGTGSDLQWDGASGGSINQTTNEVTWVNTGTFRLKRTFPGGCTGTPLYSTYYTIQTGPSAPSSLSQTAGCGQTTLNYGGSFYDTFWQISATGTDESYRTSRLVTSAGTYYARSKASNGCWGTASSFAGTITAAPVGGTLKIESNYTSGTFLTSVNKNLYLSEQSGTLKEYHYTENGTDHLIAQTTSPLNVNLQSTTAVSRVYWAVITNGTCNVSSSSVTITINGIPSFSTDPKICPGGTAFLNVPNLGGGCNAGNIEFDYGPGGVTPTILSATDASVQLTIPGTYVYKRVFSGVNCGIIERGHSVLVFTAPASPTTGELSQQIGCGTTTLNYTGASNSMYWQTSATGTDETYKSTRPVTTAGTYFARIRNSDNCWSSAVSYTPTVASTPVGGTLKLENNYTSGTFLTNVYKDLYLIGQNNNIKEYRYTENGVENVIAQTTSPLKINFQSATPVTRVYWAVVTNGYCNVPSSSVTITISGLASNASDPLICPRGIAPISISNLGGGCTAGNIEFDSGPSGVSPSITSETNATVQLTTPGTYIYKRVFSGANCGILERGQFIIVLPAPAAPKAGDISQQIGCGQVTLNYNGNAPDTYWQTTANGFAVDYLNTRTVTSAGDYYVNTKGFNGCWSLSTLIHVNNPPQIPSGGVLAGDPYFTSGSFVATVNKNIFLSGQTSGSSIKEYRYLENGVTAGVVATTSSTLNVDIVNLTGGTMTREYWAVVTKDGCEGTSTHVSFSVSAIPVAIMKYCPGSVVTMDISKNTNCPGGAAQFAYGPAVVSPVPDPQNESQFSMTLTVPGIYVFKRRYTGPMCDYEIGKSVEILANPDASPTPVVNSFCNSILLKYTGTPPTGVEWNWEGQNPNGYARNATLTYMPTLPGQYYLRASKQYDDNVCWAPLSSSITLSSADFKSSATAIPSIISICNNDNTVTLTSDDAADRWFESEISTVPLSSTNVITTSLAYKSLFVERQGIGGCFFREGYPIDVTTTTKCGEYINSIRKKSPSEATVSISNVAKKIESTAYFDGLGRSIQSTATKGSSSEKDIITPVVYNSTGMESTKFLPYVSYSDDGSFQVNPVGATGGYSSSPQFQFYNQPHFAIVEDSKPFAVTVFEPSPLKRVVKQGASGTNWQPEEDPSLDKSVHTKYGFNANDVMQVTYDTQTGKVDIVGLYLQNQLYMKITYDEHKNQVVECIDKEGRTVCKKIQSGGTQQAPVFAETYYLYDDFGNLVLVLSPQGVKQLKAEFNLN